MGQLTEKGCRLVPDSHRLKIRSRITLLRKAVIWRAIFVQNTNLDQKYRKTRYAQFVFRLAGRQPFFIYEETFWEAFDSYVEALRNVRLRNRNDGLNLKFLRNRPFW